MGLYDNLLMMWKLAEQNCVSRFSVVFYVDFIIFNPALKLQYFK